MQTYHLKLQSEIFKTFRCQRAANSLDIDTNKKSSHEILINADVSSEFSIGLIIGASGSGKTTLAKHIFGEKCFDFEWDESKSIIDQFPENLSYDECAAILSGIGLTSVPCWIRPIYTLSNGQKARAQAALALSRVEQNQITILDEWTSVVDRTVAKVMSHCVQKLIKKTRKKIILLSCHYDVLEWLNPDWVIDCNEQKFIDRRLLCPESRQRIEQFEFQIRQIDNKSWSYFSKYHYLSSKIANGKAYYFGLFQNQNQIGFIAYTNYVPHSNKSKPMILHANRIVIHPDYCGFGIGNRFLDETAKIMKEKKYKVMIKFSSIPMFFHLRKNPKWKCINQTRKIGVDKMSRGIGRTLNPKSFRHNVKTWTFILI